MKICYDGIGISHFKNTGLYTYTFEVLNRLINLYPQPEYRVISNKFINSCPSLVNKVDFIEMNLDRHNNNYDLLENYLRSNNINIYHSPNNGFSLPSKKVCKYVITMHNLMPLSHPQYVDIKYYNKFKSLVPTALEKADKIIAVSEFIKKELLDHFNIPKDKITVIPPPVSKIFRPMNKEKCRSLLKRKYKIDGNFLLSTGSIHERKHLDTLLIVFKKILEYNSDLKLVIVGNNRGKKQSQFLKLNEYCKKLGIHRNVLWKGLVDYRDMPYLYNTALCVIAISDYEGFPLSPLEALACESPVICSDSSSFREILGEAAIYVNHKDIDAFKNVLLEILQRESDGLTNNLIDISKYKSDDTIRQLVRTYESIV